MIFRSWLVDQKIRGVNVLADFRIGEYVQLAEQIIGKNELQRRRVKTFTRTYELLKRDLLEGCVIPPLILAVTESFGARNPGFQPLVDHCLARPENVEIHAEELESFVKSAINEEELIILDGLQRTHTLRQCMSETRGTDEGERFAQRTLRVEIYLGLRKLGLLYRMLTLNTGQVPMSFRHQIEIMYNDYLDTDQLPDGIRITRELEGARARGLGKYKYADVVDMFYSYTTGNPQSIDRPALVGQLKEIDFLQDFAPTDEDQGLLSLLRAYHAFTTHLSNRAPGWMYSPSELFDDTPDRPFGSDVATIFGKVQPMTGFGAECHRLIKQQSKYRNLSGIAEAITRCDFETEHPDTVLDQLIRILDDIARKAKKIGDAQRLFFQLAFRQLFLPESDSFCDLSKCWLAAQQQYELLYGG